MQEREDRAFLWACHKIPASAWGTFPWPTRAACVRSVFRSKLHLLLLLERRSVSSPIAGVLPERVHLFCVSHLISLSVYTLLFLLVTSCIIISWVQFSYLYSVSVFIPISHLCDLLCVMRSAWVLSPGMNFTPTICFGLHLIISITDFTFRPSLITRYTSQPHAWRYSM